MSGSDSASEFADTTSLYARAKWWFDKLTSAECIRLYVCPVLVVQNSAMFLVMKHSTALHDDHYHTTVAVLMQEIFKLIISITLIVTSAGGFVEPLEKLWGLRRQALVLAIPAVCYTGQNNLLYVGVTYLPAAVAQVLVQTKLLWAAVFSITLLGKRFSREAWTSFVVLIVGVVLVKNGDSRKHGPAGESSSLGAGALIGMAASIGSAGLSGFAGVYLERTFNKGVATLLQMNVWLAVVSIPLQTLAIIEFDREGIARDGLFHGFHLDTWGVICLNSLGGLLTAVVIKFAGNILKGFATALALISTSLISIPMLGFSPAALFWVGLVAVILSTFMYSTSPFTQLIARLLKPPEHSGAEELDDAETLQAKGSHNCSHRLPAARQHGRFKKLTEDAESGITLPMKQAVEEDEDEVFVVSYSVDSCENGPDLHEPPRHTS